MPSRYQDWGLPPYGRGAAERALRYAGGGGARMPAGFPLAALAAAAILVVALAVLPRVRPPRRPAPPHAGELLSPHPPSEAAPALAATLAGARQKPGMLALATLFDLERRGAVAFVEGSSRSLDAPVLDIERRSAPRTASLHEQALLAMPFGEREAARDRVSFLDAARALRRAGRFRRALRDETRAAGLVDPARCRARTRLLLAGVVLLVARSRTGDRRAPWTCLPAGSGWPGAWRWRA